jgi:hypothetical protein
MAVSWVVAPFTLEEIYECFRGTCCFHHQGAFYQSTRRYNPEDSHLHTRRLENFKSSLTLLVFYLKNFITSSSFQILMEIFVFRRLLGHSSPVSYLLVLEACMLRWCV